MKCLSCAAPISVWERGDGGWFTHSWTIVDVREAKSAGAWFIKGRHSFANGEAEKEAFRE